MTEAVLETQPKTVLEIGTGSGYQAAMLVALGLQVFTVERIGDLLRGARKRFRKLGMEVRSRHDDGRVGWAEHAPFDAIVVTAGAAALESALIDQLAPGGTLVAPVNGQLLRLRKSREGEIEQVSLAPVSFVPLLAGVIDG